MNKHLQHAIKSDFVQVALGLGHTPSLQEYLSIGQYSEQQIKEIGGVEILAMSMGMGPAKKKVDPQELRLRFMQWVAPEIEARRKILQGPPLIGSDILILGDLHCPYQHPDAVRWLIALNERFRFDLVLSAGDEIDGHAISFHDKDPDTFSAGHELEAAILALQPLYKAFPRMVLAESNHGSLVYRKAKHHGLPRRVIRSYREVIEAPDGWEWMTRVPFFDNKGSQIELAHSYSANVLLASQKRGRSLVCGHHHTKLSIQFWENWERIYFGAFTGCLIDDVALAMAYNKEQVDRPLMGSLRILNGEPQILRMGLDKFGRWDERLPDLAP